MRQDLVDPAAGHDVAAEKDGDSMLGHSCSRCCIS
jgi:hypothetical protein